MKMTVKSGDNVLVIAGKDKGKTGKVSAVYADSNKVLVENVNIVSKHQKPKSQQDKGGIFKRPAPIEASNVLVVCPVCGKATRVAHTEIDGKKVRSCKKCGASLDKEFVKQTKKEAKKAMKASDLKGANLKAVGSEEKKSTKKKAEEKVEVATEEKKTTSTAKKTTSTAKKTTSTAKKSTAAKSTTTKSTAAKSTAKTATTKTTAKSTKSEGSEEKKTTKKSTTAKKETK